MDECGRTSESAAGLTGLVSWSHRKAKRQGQYHRGRYPWTPLRAAELFSPSPTSGLLSPLSPRVPTQRSVKGFPKARTPLTIRMVSLISFHSL